ncbi:hypothetical protein [Streptomyces sp. R08]|uniref:Hydrophobic W protein n=1 Tax=Streptomyces sp. R08 TaxID=3238624 RepID=A0AB39LZV4_9ACTN
MSRGEETDEPITGDEHAVSADSVEFRKEEPAGETSGQAPRFAVVISGDGSAAIDGEPVPVGEGTPVDAAILDALHGHARDRNTTVTAVISDPAAGYVAFVEVAPDGSSSLVEQQEQPPEPDEVEPVPVLPPLGDAESAEEAVRAESYEAVRAEPYEAVRAEPYEAVRAESYEMAAGAGSFGADDDLDDDDVDDEDLDDGVTIDLDDDADAGHDDNDDHAYHHDDPDADVYGPEHQHRLEEPTPPPPHTSASIPIPRPQLARVSGSRQSDDAYQSPGLLHKPLVVGPVALAVAALVVVPLVILGSGGSGDGGSQAQAARASKEADGTSQADKKAPTGLPSASTLLPPPSATATTPTAKATKPKGAKTPKGGGVPAGVTVTVTAKPPRATVTAKPAQDTAATAVNRLHRSDPSGRHICYRAYLTGQGWQKPVCDGTLAGTTGDSHPVTALNIAVYGVGGSAANAFIHDPASTSGQGKWEPHWTASIADGRNNYIGSTKSSAPYMTGFAINVGTGQVCRIAKVRGYDWGPLGCTDPATGYVFGGTLENTRYLEAVKFTV